MQNTRVYVGWNGKLSTLLLIGFLVNKTIILWSLFDRTWPFLLPIINKITFSYKRIYTGNKFQINDISIFMKFVSLCANCIYTYLHRVWMRLGLPKFRLKLEGCQIRENFSVCIFCLHCTKESDCHDIVLRRFIGFFVVFIY